MAWGQQKTEYVYSTCLPSSVSPTSHVVSGWASASVMKDSHEESSHGLLSLPNSSSAQASLSLLFVLLQRLPFSLYSSAPLGFDNTSEASK